MFWKYLDELKAGPAGITFTTFSVKTHSGFPSCVGCPLCVQAAVKWEVTANFCESVIYLFILSGLIGLSLLIKNSDYVSGRTQALQ